jgi:hypothetical protein
MSKSYVIITKCFRFRITANSFPNTVNNNELNIMCGPGRVVGIAIGYVLDGLGIESRWGRDFSHLSRPALGPNQPPVQWVPRLSWGKMRPGRDADHSPPSSSVVMKV